MLGTQGIIKWDVTTWPWAGRNQQQDHPHTGHPLLMTGQEEEKKKRGRTERWGGSWRCEWEERRVEQCWSEGEERRRRHRWQTGGRAGSSHGGLDPLIVLCTTASQHILNSDPSQSTFLPVGRNFLLFVSLPLLWVNPKFISLVGSAGGLGHTRSPCESPSNGTEILIGFLLDLPLLHQFLWSPRHHSSPNLVSAEVKRFVPHLAPNSVLTLGRSSAKCVITLIWTSCFKCRDLRLNYSPWFIWFSGWCWGCTFAGQLLDGGATGQ